MPLETAQQSGAPQITTTPAPVPSGCDSDGVIDLPPSLRFVPGPDAVTFCGFLDADEIQLEEVELVGEPQPEAAQRHAKMLPPPLVTPEDLEEELIYPSNVR